LGLCIAILLTLAFHENSSSRRILYNPGHLYFLGFCVLALVWAPDVGYGVRTLAKLAAPYLFLVFILTVVKTHRELDRMERVVVGVGLFVLATATIAKLAGMIPDADRFTIPFTSAAGFTALLALIALIALGNVLYKGPRHLIIVLMMSAGVLVAMTR